MTMNNPNIYRVISVKKRRKHLCAVVLEPVLELSDVQYEKDDKGTLLLDFSLAEDGIVAENMQLGETDIIGLVNESYYRKAKSRALWYLSSADQSRRGLIRKLSRTFPAAACEKAVDKMCEMGYIDDEKFAKSQCEILAARGLSNSGIVSKLISYGVSPALAKECVQEAETDQVAQIENLIQKKYRNKLGDDDSVRRTVSALARRGFSFSDIRAAIKKFTDTQIDEEC